MECFKYCFEKWCLKHNPQEFWDAEYPLTTQMIEHIDLDDKVWRRLFEVVLKKYLLLRIKVDKKKHQLADMKLAALGVLGELIQLDVVKYCVCEYL
jgi:hypothetical protein